MTTEQADTLPESIAAARRADYIAFLHRTPFATTAWQLGFGTGLREDYTLQQEDLTNLNVPVFMLDNEFRDPDVDRWVRIFEKYRPKVGVLADAYTREEAQEYVSVATELKDRFPDSELIIVPKCDCFDLIPQWVVLGYPAGGQNSGGQSRLHPRDYSSIDDWRGRRVHLLGASPQQQWRAIRRLTEPTLDGLPPANIIGTDWNGVHKVAVRGSQYYHHEKPHWRERHDLDDHELVAKGLRHIKRYWKQRGVWPTTTPREQYGPAVLTPDDPVFASRGMEVETGDPTANNAPIHRERAIPEEPAYSDGPVSQETEAVVVEYEDGTRLAYESDTRRSFAEYRMGVLREHGQPVRTVDDLQRRKCVTEQAVSTEHS